MFLQSLVFCFKTIFHSPSFKANQYINLGFMFILFSFSVGPFCMWILSKETHYFQISNITRVMQPVATCCQSPYLHKPAVVIVMSFSLWRLAPTAYGARSPHYHCDVFRYWAGHAHCYGRTYVTDTVACLIYKDSWLSCQQLHDFYAGLTLTSGFCAL